MLILTPKHKIFIAVQYVDFRRGLDGLIALCRQTLQLDPFSGHFFVFRNRKGNSIKIVVYDSQGFWLHQKRLSRGHFKHWPKSKHAVIYLTHAQLNVLLFNGDPSKVMTAPAWRAI